MRPYHNKLLRGSCLFFWALLLSSSLLVLGAHTVAAQPGPYAEGPDISRWIAERARRARMGRPEQLRVPLVRRSDGWGCICPEYYIGLSPLNTGRESWIEPLFGRQNQRPRKNTILLAHGYFTGRRLRRDLRSTVDQPEEWIYSLWEFRVTSVRLLPEDHDVYDELAPKNRVAVLGNSIGSRRKRE